MWLPNPPDLCHLGKGDGAGSQPRDVPCTQRAGSSGRHAWHNPSVGPCTLVSVPAALKIPGRKTTPRGAMPGVYLALQAPGTRGPGCKPGDVCPPPPAPWGRSGVPSPSRWSGIFFYEHIPAGGCVAPSACPVPSGDPVGAPRGGPRGRSSSRALVASPRSRKGRWICSSRSPATP